MRVYVRTTRNTGVSLGPVALLVLSPVVAAWWAGVLIVALAIVLVRGIVLLARKATT